MSPYTPNIQIGRSSQTLKHLTGAVWTGFCVLFELTAMSWSTLVKSCRDISLVELSQKIKCLAQGHNTVTLSKARGFEKFSLILHLHPNVMYASSEASGENKKQNLVFWPTEKNVIHALI